MSFWGVSNLLLRSERHATWATTVSTHRIKATHASHHGIITTTHSSHAAHHVWLGKHEELHLLLLHMLRNLWVLVNLVVEESCLEFVLGETVVNSYPVVGDAADQNWHHHWILSHLREILRLEHIKSKII
jgi:hypothetical protein